jgi:AhpC/TSA family/Thiol:disulfide interchange protein DsbD, N-terminal
VELESQLEALRSRGLGLAAISYDSVEILKSFADRRKITFPLLSDPDSSIIKRFGLQNEVDYPVGDPAHGVPYPGTFVTDASGLIRAKFFETKYTDRRTAGSFLALTGATPPVTGEARTETFTLLTSTSNVEAAPGQRLTLVLDFEMKPRMHAYAPGVSGYRPLRVKLDPQPLATVHDPVFPPSQPFVFAPLQETVPVFEGRFRVFQDVTLAGRRELAEALQAPEPKLELTGSLEYQVCSDERCYPPGALPLRWTIRLIPPDGERAPEALQRKPAR